jgi:hypothetical protein
MSTFRVDDGELLRMEKVLGELSSKGQRFAVRAVLNQVAYDAAGRARNEIRKSFTVRNNYTVRSVVYEKVPPGQKDPNKMVSVVGSMQEYMAKQEEGFTERSSGKHGVEVPTGETAGTPGAIPRRKAVKRAFYRRGLKMSKGWGDAKTEKGLLMEKVFMAMKSGRRVISATLKGLPGLWLLKGGRRGGRGWPRGARLHLLYSMGKKSVAVKPTPWLSRAAKTAAAGTPELYRKELEKQIEAIARANALKASGGV